MPFETTLKLLNQLIEWPFCVKLQQAHVPGVVLRHLVPRTDQLQLSVVILLLVLSAQESLCSMHAASYSLS